MNRIFLLTVFTLSCTCIPAMGQDVAGLSYCLLFDSDLEKGAFQKNSDAEADPLIYLLAYDAQVDSTKFLRVQNEISAFASKLMSKRARFKTETKFLRFAFQRVHHKYLRSYSHSEPFNGIFNDGTYNCVSGAALYSCILQQFGYKPVIYETRYHIFLMVNLADSTRVFFETTDPITGFECDDREIDSRIEKYLSAEQALLGNATALSAPFDKDVVRESISLKQLAGLHYYNLAVDLINKQNYYDAFRSLKKASILYPKSKRIKDFLGFTAIRYESELSAAFSDR